MAQLRRSNEVLKVVLPVQIIVVGVNPVRVVDQGLGVEHSDVAPALI